MTKLSVAFKVFLVAFLAGAMLVSPVFASQASAQDAISSAKNTLKTCYEAVSKAESAGANVAVLMATINDAAGLLSKAELAYASNDYDSTYTYAAQSQSKLSNLTSQATELTASAQANETQNTVYTVLSVVVSFGLLCAGIVAWVVLGRQERRVSDGTAKI